MKQIKKQLVNYIVDNIENDEDEFVLFNGGGGVEGKLSREEVESMIESCKTKAELSRLVMIKWKYSDIYESFEQLLEQIAEE